MELIESKSLYKLPSKCSALRTGQIHTPETKFGKEERFQWQKPRYVNDVMYNTPSMLNDMSVVFPTAPRADMIDNEVKLRNNGPGSYDFTRSYDFNSEYVSKKGYRFSGSSRLSMAVKTPSPGAVYNIEKKYYNGPDTFKGISFGHETRRTMDIPTSTNNIRFTPKDNINDKGRNSHAVISSLPGVTIAKRLVSKKTSSEVPGPIYDVHKHLNFKTGPSFSFAAGKGDRFREQQYLPELD